MAGDWLRDYLISQGGSSDSASIKRHGSRAGHSHDALKRARKRLGFVAESKGFPRRTIWSLPQPQSERRVEQCPTALTAPTAPTGVQSEQSAQLVQSEQLAQWGRSGGVQ
jgi:hypothetical protein